MLFDQVRDMITAKGFDPTKIDSEQHISALEDYCDGLLTDDECAQRILWESYVGPNKYLVFS